jgi:probable phosphoglycerate mutase
MKTELFLVRHGETAWNKEGKFQGCTDINLSEEGILQARLLMERLKTKFDYIYTSPLSRAVQTANIICEETATIKPVIVQDLREINFGKWEGLTFEQIKEQYPSEFKIWRTDEEHANLVGGDLSLKNSSTRVTNAILNIANEHIGQKTVIVAHGGIIKAGIIGLFDWKMTMYHRFFLGNTSVTKISFGKSMTPVLISLNDMSHLSID